jgi:hypothetical protein
MEIHGEKRGAQWTQGFYSQLSDWEINPLAPMTGRREHLCP